MNANLPRSYKRLPPSEQQHIKDVFADELNKTAMIMLDIFLKMSCKALHDVHGLGEKRLTDYLGTYRRIFARQVKLVKAGTQIEELDREMRKIFRRGGYPDEFFKMMFADWQVNTGKDEPNA